MDIGTLTRLIRANDANELRKAFIKEHHSRYDPVDFMNYDPCTHRIIIDRIHRRDKIIYFDIPGEFLQDGTPAKGMKIIPVTRVAVAFQKEIVDTTVSFSVGGKITLDANPIKDIEKILYEGVRSIWGKNKMKFRVKDIARKLFSQTECAVIVYAAKDDDNQVDLKIKLISPADDYTLYPIYDGIGDMIAFGMEYLTQDYKFSMDVYTKDYLYKYADLGQGFSIQKTVPLNYGKIPIVYFNQDESEWKKVQHLIERYEQTLSNLCDTNDYNGSPILFASGKIEGFADKGETGKVIEGTDGSDLKYLTWDKAPESIKLELKTIEDQIYTKTRTVNLSPESIKGMGSAPSGVAFDRMLISPHMKGQDKQDGSLGEGLQRIVNIFKSAFISLIEPKAAEAKNLFIEPNIDLFRIDDLAERIQTMAVAMPGKVIVSMKTAVAYIGMVNNTEDEVKNIDNENQPIAKVAPPANA